MHINFCERYRNNTYIVIEFSIYLHYIECFESDCHGGVGAEQCHHRLQISCTTVEVLSNAVALI